MPSTYQRRRAKDLCPKRGKIPAVGSLCLDDWFKAVASTHLNQLAAGPVLRRLWEKQNGCCAYTGEVLTPGVNSSLDHIIPVTRGGSLGVENLQWVAYRVNRMKTDMLEEEFWATCKTILEQRGFIVTR